MHREKGTANTPQAIIQEIIAQHAAGVTIKELSKEYGKPFWTIKNMVRRERKKGMVAIPLRQSRGRKPAVTLQEYKYENERLSMENELLRDFLHLAGRK